MKVHLTATELRLSRRQTLRLPKAAGVRITARQGILWVTQDHDLRDIVLRAGESIIFDSAAPVVVQALDAARFGLSQTPVAPIRPQGVARWLHDLGAALARLHLRLPASS